jgi:hypothetical protein
VSERPWKGRDDERRQNRILLLSMSMGMTA